MKVNGAFRKFLEDSVNISSNESEKAKRSRDYLISQLNNLSSNGIIPKLCPSYNVNFGSFSRKTKISPLDDIDLIVVINGKETTYFTTSWDNVSMKISSKSTDGKLYAISDTQSSSYTDSSRRINSNRVKNCLLGALTKIPQYSKAELHSKGEAVTLSLTSYNWNFDIVPAFYCVKGDKEFYLIPNGNGNWKKTNPKLEQERVSALNSKFNGEVLNTIKLIKYWNRRGKMPNFTSYVLETLVLDYFDQAKHSVENRNGKYDYPDMHFAYALGFISNHILSRINDTKGIQSDINDLDFSARVKIRDRASSDSKKALSAISAEIYEDDHEKSIKIWRDLFGEDFPRYE